MLEQQCELLHANEVNSQGCGNSNTLSSHQQLKMTHMKVFELSYRRDDGALVEKEQGSIAAPCQSQSRCITR